MDIFTQKKILVRIVLLLIALNLCLIGMIIRKEFLQKPPRPDQPRGNKNVTAILEEKLGLNRDQADQIKRIRASFFEKEKMISESIRNERDSMNTSMFNKSTDETLVKSLAKKISDNEYKMEILRFEQAQELKTVCTPEQLEKLETLILEIRDFFKPENQPKRK
jgi:Spy/CpxP family protein refolding chaperone